MDTVIKNRFKHGNGWAIAAEVTFDTSYPTGGETLLASTLGLSVINAMTIENSGGYSFDYDKTNAKVLAYMAGAHTHAVALDTGATAAGASHNHVFTGTAITPEDVVVKDNDDAATAGVAVYLHTKDGRTGWLEFVSPTNANGTGLLKSTGSTYFISDSDAAATGGVAIYFDEDAATVDRRFLCVSPSGKDIYVPVAGSNQCLVFKHDASANSNGVQVYFDEDAATTHERLMFVSPTNANGVGATDDTYTSLAPVSAGTNAAEATHTHAAGTLADAASASASATAAEVTNATNLSEVVTQLIAYGY